MNFFLNVESPWRKKKTDKGFILPALQTGSPLYLLNLFMTAFDIVILSLSYQFWNNSYCNKHFIKLFVNLRNIEVKVITIIIIIITTVFTPFLYLLDNILVLVIWMGSYKQCR